MVIGPTAYVVYHISVTGVQFVRQKEIFKKEKKIGKKKPFSPHQGTVPMEPWWAHGRLPFTSCHLAWFHDLLYIQRGGTRET